VNGNTKIAGKEHIMKSKNEIVEILKSHLSSVYCDTCQGDDCEECHRKMMNWGISSSFAEKLADEILE